MPTRSPFGREVRTLLTENRSFGWGKRCAGSGVGPRRVGGEVQESSCERLPVGVAADHQHRVVAGDGAQDAVEVGAVERRREELRGAGRGAQHHLVARRVRGDEQLPRQPRQPAPGGERLAHGPGRAVAALGRHRVDQRPRREPDLDRVELDEVTRQGGLRDREPSPGEELRELGLGAHLVAAQQLGDLLLPGPLGGRDRRAHVWCSISQTSSAFWAWSRFSASSQTTLRGPSMTSAAISLPRYAGRQCITIASSAACASRSASTAYGRNGAIRCSASSSLPIDTQVSVTTTSAPATASTGSVTWSADPPVVPATSAARASTSGSGANPSGPLTRTRIPAVAPASRNECDMFEAASPRTATERPASVPLCSSIVSRSASSWQGWNSSVSAFTTGTPACCAISSRRS